MRFKFLRCSYFLFEISSFFYLVYYLLTKITCENGSTQILIGLSIAGIIISNLITGILIFF